ncbi:MAG TPA: flagellar motor protein MotB [Sedimentisphaerales bacterium]|nr:flagellar motor protein MotB [Sedimentisphaerales bacterium]
MGRSRKQAETGGSTGVPEWMVTFSDCMTLLLTFFVLLLAFSSFDQSVIVRLRSIFNEAMPSVGLGIHENKDAFLPSEQVQALEEPDEGSEKPALVDGSENNLKEDTEPVDFYSRKVFLIPSEKVFWGEGTAISSEGRYIIGAMASLLKEVPNRIVVGEHGPSEDGGSEKLGLPRAWMVIQHLTIEEGVDRKKFSISAAPIGVKDGFRNIEKGRAGSEVDRVVEIVLLERSICN